MGKFSEPKVAKRENKPKESPKYTAQMSDSTDAESSDSDHDSLGEDEGRKDVDCTENKLERKLRQAEAKLREQALKIIAERENGPRITSSGLHEVVEQQRKKQTRAEKRQAKRTEARRKTAVAVAKQEKQYKKAAAMQEELNAQAKADGDVFMIDVNPTKANREKLEAPSEDEDEDEDIGVGNTTPNRGVRRRLKLIAKQKKVIQTLLDVPFDSDEKAEEVQKLLDEWTVEFDEKARARKNKTKDRKDKTTTRLRNRSERLLETVREGRVDKSRGGSNKKSRKTIRRPTLSRSI